MGWNGWQWHQLFTSSSAADRLPPAPSSARLDWSLLVSASLAEPVKCKALLPVCANCSRLCWMMLARILPIYTNNSVAGDGFVKERVNLLMGARKALK